MRTIAAFAFASSLALAAVPALAADAPGDIIMGDGVVTDESGFDWDRFYATIYVVHVYGDVADSNGVGLSIGGNMTSGALLYGGTLSAGTFRGGQMDGEYIAQGVVRAGLLATDSLALYGLTGVGWETYNDDYFVPVGAGAELAVSDNLTLKLQYQANWVAGQSVNDVWAQSISAAVAVYF